MLLNAYLMHPTGRSAAETIVWDIYNLYLV